MALNVVPRVLNVNYFIASFVRMAFRTRKSTMKTRSVAADIFILLPSIATLIIHDIKARSIAAAMHDFYQKLYEGREDNSNNSNQVKTSSH